MTKKPVKKAKPAPKAAGTTTYLLTLKNGNLQKITVPSAWKVTFGPIAPGSKSFESNGGAGMCLRFYEDQSKQRAVFTDVKSFRDMSIAIEERVTKTQQQRMKKQTPQGEKDFVVEAKVSQWVDPDREEGDVPDEFLALPNMEMQQL